MSARLTDEDAEALCERLEYWHIERPPRDGKPAADVSAGEALAALRALLAERRELRDALCDPVFLNHGDGCVRKLVPGQCDCGVHSLNERRRALLAPPTEVKLKRPEA